MYARVPEYQPAYAIEIVIREFEVAPYRLGLLGTASLLLLHGVPDVNLSWKAGTSAIGSIARRE
jgi:hypothetical protein